MTPGPVGGAVAEDLTAALADIYREYIAGHDRFDPSYYDRPVRGFEISTRRDVLAVIARSVIEDHFQKALPHVPAAEIVEAVVDAYERRQDLIGRYRALKTNPAIDPRIAEVFEEMTAKLGRRFSDLGPVELVADERAAKGGERQYAYCKSGPEGTEIAFASRAADLPLSNLRGLMAHELGHALDFRYSEEELRRRLGPLELDAGAERRADQLAEAALGTRILYDRRDVQCVGCRTGTSPRPAHLAKNTYRP